MDNSYANQLVNELRTLNQNKSKEIELKEESNKLLSEISKSLEKLTKPTVGS